LSAAVAAKLPEASAPAPNSPFFRNSLRFIAVRLCSKINVYTSNYKSKQARDKKVY
jgi:hypothetical protein